MKCSLFWCSVREFLVQGFLKLCTLLLIAVAVVAPLAGLAFGISWLMENTKWFAWLAGVLLCSLVFASGLHWIVWGIRDTWKEARQKCLRKD